jgi:Stage II sporulation protein E (SpoIIE)
VSFLNGGYFVCPFNQGHRGHDGYAWYRRHITLAPAPGVSPDFVLMIPAIDDVYEIYWNGTLVGHLGSMPPNLRVYHRVGAQTYPLGPVRSGVLAVRVFKFPFASPDDGLAGGFRALPLVGSPEAIRAVTGAMDFRRLRNLQFRFALTSLYGLVSLLSLFAWLRDRKQRLLFWTAVFSCMLLLETPLAYFRLHVSYSLLQSLIALDDGVREVALWFLLLYLLRLEDDARIARLLRTAVMISLITIGLDALLLVLFPHWIGARTFKVADALLTCVYLPTGLAVLLPVGAAFFQRKRLDSARWIVAIFAFLNTTYFFIESVAWQGSRFTHWTIAQRMETPFFYLYGSPITGSLVLRTLLFLSIVYAVIRYALENRRRQAALEREFQNARELQQVLIPESLPTIPGFTLTSAYRPAQEVGGDFFQIIPLANGSTLIVLGDVSGKGLRAAMAVSLIVGATHMAAETTFSPAEILSALNRRLDGRLNGGFATAIALRLDLDGQCVLASAGHPAPFLNGDEMQLPGALPLGITANSVYEQRSLRFSEADRLSIYTDGLLEARSASGELYGFGRLQSLFAGNPTAAEATQAAVDFGQDDDITVLTLARLAIDQKSTSERGHPGERAAAVPEGDHAAIGKLSPHSSLGCLSSDGG